MKTKHLPGRLVWIPCEYNPTALCYRIDPAPSRWRRIWSFIFKES